MLPAVFFDLGDVIIVDGSRGQIIVVRPDGDILPIFLGPCVIDILKICAAGKGRRANFCYAIGNIHAFQAVTSPERFRSNHLHTIGDGYARQADTSGKGIGIDILYTIRNFQICQKKCGRSAIFPLIRQKNWNNFCLMRCEYGFALSEY